MVGPFMSDVHQSISTEKVLRLLADQQRRQILRRVADTPDGTTVDQLKSHPEMTNSVNPDESGSVERREIDLHHVHLPKLREANVIEYDPRQGTVHRGREFQDVFSLLEVIDSHREDPSTAIS